MASSPVNPLLSLDGGTDDLGLTPWSGEVARGLLPCWLSRFSVLPAPVPLLAGLALPSTSSVCRSWASLASFVAAVGVLGSVKGSS